MGSRHVRTSAFSGHPARPRRNEFLIHINFRYPVRSARSPVRSVLAPFVAMPFVTFVASCHSWLSRWPWLPRPPPLRASVRRRPPRRRPRRPRRQGCPGHAGCRGLHHAHRCTHASGPMWLGLKSKTVLGCAECACCAYA